MHLSIGMYWLGMDKQGKIESFWILCPMEIVILSFSDLCS